MQNQTTLPATPVHGIVTMPFAPYYDEGGITIYNADCRQVLPFLPKFDLLLTDPPYGIGDRLANGGTQHKKGFGSLVNSDAGEWDVKVEPWLLAKLIEQTQNQIIWGGNFYQLPPCDQPLCWDKVRPNQKNLSEWEYAWTSFVGRARLFAHCGNGGFVAKEARVHPTQKPLALMRWCLSIAKDSETIIDPFAGSGTTGAACKLEGRKAVLIEISQEYCEKAADRLRQGVLF